MSNIICRNCDEEFERPARRGRPPVNCDNCKGSSAAMRRPDVNKALSAADRVARLEMQLKAANLHISQHRE